MRISGIIDSYSNHRVDADKVSKDFGRTPMYSFFDPKLNEFFSGGLAKPNATNIILVFGQSGVGKSLFTLNILASAIREKKKFAHLILEDDAAEMLERFRKIVPEREIYASDHILLSERDFKEHFDQNEALELFENLYKDHFVDIIVLDHIQFLFEASADGSQENEWIRQRRFVQELNRIVKTYKKTLVLVSHIKKGQEIGLDSTTGSNSIPQVATKAISIFRDENKQLCIKQEKSRYTKPYFDKIPIRFDRNLRLLYDDGANDSGEESL